MHRKQLVKCLVGSIKITPVIIIIINTLSEHFQILLVVLSFDLKYILILLIQKNTYGDE